MPRNVIIDAMRFLGLLLIMLAHVNPPGPIFQIRTFDVPMMVFVSGMSFFLSKKSDSNFITYSFSRFKRLVLPVWAFLILFFSFIYIFKPEGFLDLLSLKIVASTFMLNGFGYVWVIRVFLIIAILSPLYVYMVEKANGYNTSLIALTMLLCGVVASTIKYENESKLIAHLFYDVIIPAISYGAVFIIGYKFINFKENEKIFLFSLFTLSLLLYISYNFMVHNTIYGPQKYKYPPTLYYISYSMIMIMVANYILNVVLYKKQLPTIILKISSNTIWIYLWHIPVVEFFHRYNTEFSFIMKYVLAVCISTTITIVQTSLINKFLPNSKLIKNIFTG